jgi:hypothetical protein
MKNRPINFLKKKSIPFRREKIRNSTIGNKEGKTPSKPSPTITKVEQKFKHSGLKKSPG